MGVRTSAAGTREEAAPTGLICGWIAVFCVACSSTGGTRGGPNGTDIGPRDPGKDLPVIRDFGYPDDVLEMQTDVGDDASTPEADGTDLATNTEPEACLPQCEGRECGDNGCGGLCGYCPYGSLCKAGLCVEYCVPDCTGKQCGDDGCGGLCGDCEVNEFCAEDFHCVLKGCVPDCAGRACGPDGCGGSCGTCGDGQVCDPKAWQCVVDTSCHEVTAEGRCVGSLLQWCEAGVLKQTECDPAQGLVCGFSQVAKKYACIPPEQCEPQCSGRECGPDQCGGTCGDCRADQVCSTGGRCGAPCGTVGEAGICDQEVLKFCHQGILIAYDCAAHGLHCEWDPTGNSGKGWYDCL